jgi:hypothetical protein
MMAARAEVVAVLSDVMIDPGTPLREWECFPRSEGSGKKERHDMGLRLRLRAGPFIYTERLGRTQAQKRAAAQLRQNRRRRKPAPMSSTGTVVSHRRGFVTVHIAAKNWDCGPAEDYDREFPVTRKNWAQVTVLPPGQRVSLRFTLTPDQLLRITSSP